MKSEVRFIAITLLFGASMMVTGCFDKDERVIPREINEIRIPYSLYQSQTYFNLAGENIVASHSYAEWDLGFECSPEGYHVILNSSKYMLAGGSGSTDFASVTSNTADTLVFDASSGDMSRTALEGWADFSDPLNPVFSGEVYIIDRGTDEHGDPFGMRKLVIEKLENDTYTIRFAKFDGSGEVNMDIPKDPLLNFVLVSFNNGGTIFTGQPESSEWDILFTKYSTVIPDNYGVPTPYIVRGVLINNIAGVEAVTDTINPYYNINETMIPAYQFSDSLDAIGYEWKIYRNDSYTLVDSISYVIKDQAGLYYKLRFTDYFNDSGEKGYPAFELDNLQQ